ncbi:hypothetical protein ANCDUO_26100 [Ancylostoma duodenale]|uniref:Reverse transcriptase domain-containing protein n=1 Tax=Ancylostoma duodenale TaxID=51022 RepID=A0A0C2C2W5_9BILA|nr:hypothetical protein ANCDUO_26100 [Ancylostoma duodenale]
MEMRMLWWMDGIKQKDWKCNQDLRQRFGVVALADKLREARLRWFGHILCADGEKVCRIGFDVEVQGKRSKERPKQRSLDTLPISSCLLFIPTRRTTGQYGVKESAKRTPLKKREKR